MADAGKACESTRQGQPRAPDGKFSSAVAASAVPTPSANADADPIPAGLVAPSANVEKPATTNTEEAPQGAPAATPVAQAQPASSIVDRISSIANNLSQDDQEQLFDLIGTVMKQSSTFQDEAEEIKRQKNILEEKLSTMTEAQGMNAANIIGLLSSLYKDLAPEFQLPDAETVARTTSKISQDPDLMRTLGGIPIMANAVKFKEQELTAAQGTAQTLSQNMLKQRAELSALESKLSHVHGMGATAQATTSLPPVAHPPIWQNSAAPTMPVAVKASATDADAPPPSKRRGIVPDWLARSLSSYDVNVIGSGKVFPDNFQQPVRSMNGPGAQE